MGPSSASVQRIPALLPHRRAVERRDGLTAAQRRAMVGTILGLHVAAVWGLLQVREVRDAVADAAPMFVALVAPEKTPEPAPPAPPPPRPVPKRETPRPIVAAAPTPSPAPPTFVAPPPPPIVEPTPVVAAPAPPAPIAPPPPVQPKVIPASAVQYLEPLERVYPRLSIKLGETGHVLVRVFIDEQGVAKTVDVSRSSGFPRLDDVSMAAVRKARFKPPTENGQPISGWAFIPFNYELEK